MDGLGHPLPDRGQAAASHISGERVADRPPGAAWATSASTYQILAKLL